MRVTSTDAEAEAAQIGVRCRGLTRSFGGTLALDGVDLDVRVGTTHALVGQNGAGKSTCLGMIAGRIRPTAGEITVLNKAFHYGSPRSAQDAGVAAVYQELTVIPQLSPQANVFLSNPMMRLGFLRKKAMRKRYVATCAELGIPAAPDVPAGELTVAHQQLVEIVRAVVSRARILLLDEPTAALAIGERQALFRVLKSVRASGTTIILVSHNLDEVLNNSDTITVFRDGKLIATRPAGDWSKRELINNMLGGASQELLEAELQGSKDMERPAATIAVPAQRSVLLKAEHVRLGTRLREIDLEVRAGEVLGIAGLMGAGRSSLLRALSGAEPGTRGTLYIDGQRKPWPSSPRAARALGIGMVPEDRKTEGVCLGMSCAENVTLAQFRTASRFGYISPRRLSSTALPYLRDAGVDTTKVTHAAGSLSGGNQQKLLFARMSYQHPRILLADEPTRGVDVGAKADILEEVRRLAHEDGVGVILVSSELEEVIAFSDRILVIAEGRIAQEFDNSHGEVREDDLLSYAFSTPRATA